MSHSFGQKNESRTHEAEDTMRKVQHHSLNLKTVSLMGLEREQKKKMQKGSISSFDHQVK